MSPQRPAIQPDTPEGTNAAANPFAPKFRLRTALIVPFVLQVITVAGLVSYLYFRNEQRAVDDIATQSQQEIAVRVEQNLRGYLTIPHLVNQNNAVAINLKQLNLQSLSGLEQYLWRQLQVFDTLTFVGLGFENKDILGAERVDDGSLVLRVATQASGYDFRTYSTDQNGDRLELLHHKANFDPRTRPWYKAAVAAGGPAWSEIYPNTAGLTAYLGASMPFSNQQGNLQGVLLTNINLSQIGNFLQSLRIGKTGQVFIIERSGLLVATSTGERPYRTVQRDFGAERVKAIDSRNVLTHATMQYLNRNFTANGNINIQQSELLEFKVKGERQFLQVSPFQDQFGLDWLIVVVVPESDFTGQITANTRNTIQLTFIALAVAIGLSILTAHYITRPILRVSQASEAIAKGDLNQQVASSPIIEIETLTRSFNSMAGQLQSSFAALKQSETQNRVIVEALPDLIFRIREDGTYVDNPLGQNRPKPLLISDRWLKGDSISNSLPPPQAQQGIQAIQQALQTDESQVYEQQLVINDETINEEVRVVKIADDEVLIVVRDITKRKQLETALQESEARFRGVVEQASVGIALVTSAGQFSLVNRRVCELLGYPETELWQLTNLDVTHPEDQTVTSTAIHRLLAGKTSTFSIDKRYIRKDGQIQWANLTCSPIYNPQGELQYLLGVLVDISERKQAEENLRVAEENYRSIFENALEGIFQAAPDGHFISVNPTMARIYGYSSVEEMLSNITDIGAQTFVDPAKREEFKRLLNEQGQAKDFEYQLYQKDGSIIWIEENTRVVQNADGSVYYEGIVQDVTARKRQKEILEARVEERTIELAKANAALTASEAELRGLFAAMDDVIVVYNRQGICLKVASTHPNLLFKSSEEMVSRSVHDILPEAQASLRLEAIQQVLNTRQTTTIEYSLLISDNPASSGERKVWFSANLSPLSDDTVIMVARDISERKRVEAERQRAKAALQDQLHLIQVILDALPFPIFYKDSQGIYLGCNQAFLNYRGMTSNQIVGKSVYETAPAHLAEIYADADQALLNSKGIQTYETSVAYADGSEHDVIFYKAAFLNQQGEVSGLVGAILDISDRKQAEAELQTQQAFLQQVMNAVPSSIFVKDGEGRFLSVNQAAAAIYGVTVEEMLGKTDLSFNRDREEVKRYLADNQEVMTTRQTKVISDQAIRNRQGELRWYQTSISPFIDENGEAQGIIGALADITDRKQAEAALQNSLTQLALANQEIQSLNQQLESENLRLSAELSVARQIQQMILPKEQELKQIAGLEIAGFMEPADEVGGDYYDVLHHNGSVKIGIGDVTGHGLESGVLMIMVQTAVRTLLANNETDPCRFLSTINEVIYNNAQRMNSNKNLSLALLDYEAGHVKLSGQHEEMLVVRADGQIERIDTTNLGFFLGLLPDISEFVAQAEVQLQSGDGIVLYTDGITEAKNAAKEYYGLERLCQAVSENWRQSATEIRQAIVEDVQAYLGQQKVYDDITLLVLKQK